MNRKILIDVIKKLESENVIYENEAQIQFEIGWKLRRHLLKLKINADVRIEFPARKIKKNSNGRKCNTPKVDIVVIIGDDYYPIELKYFRSELQTPGYFIKGEGEVHMYGYAKDISKIEMFKKSYPDNFKIGYTIAFTNNTKVYNIYHTDNSRYRFKDFQLFNGENLEGEIWFLDQAKQQNYKTNKADYTVTIGKKDKYKYVVLDKVYPVNWNDYSIKIPNSPENAEFKFLINEIV